MSAQPLNRFKASRAFSRSPHVGSISFAAGTQRDCGLAAFGAPIGIQAITHRVAAATSSGPTGLETAATLLSVVGAPSSGCKA